MSSLVNTENVLFRFLEKITNEKNLEENKDYKIYRGSLPNRKLKTREENGDTKLYPCVVLRILSHRQIRTGINGYDCDVSFEIIIGTVNEEYISNLAMGDYIREKLMNKLVDEAGMSFNQDKEFKIETYNDEYGSFVFSRITFTLYGFPVEPEERNF